MKIVTNDCIAGKVSLTQLVEQIRIQVSCAIKYFRIKFEWLKMCNITTFQSWIRTTFSFGCLVYWVNWVALCPIRKKKIFCWWINCCCCCCCKLLLLVKFTRPWSELSTTSAWFQASNYENKSVIVQVKDCAIVIRKGEGGRGEVLKNEPRIEKYFEVPMSMKLCRPSWILENYCFLWMADCCYSWACHQSFFQIWEGLTSCKYRNLTTRCGKNSVKY